MPARSSTQRRTYARRPRTLAVALLLTALGAVEAHAQAFIPLSFPEVCPGWARVLLSDDGQVVVGTCYDVVQGRDYLIRWTGGEPEILAEGEGISEITGVSADGSVIVGWINEGSSKRRPIRWAGGELERLECPEGASCLAHAVSADGSIVVGAAYTDSGIRPARWDPALSYLPSPDSKPAALRRAGRCCW